MALSAAMMILLCASPARAQEDTPDAGSPPQERRGSLHLLLGVQAGLVAADMVSTAYALQLGGGAREGNPLLRPFSTHPAAMAAVSGAVNVLQTYTIIKLHPRHPRIARVWAVALIGVELYAVTNNIRVAARLRRAPGAIR